MARLIACRQLRCEERGYQPRLVQKYHANHSPLTKSKLGQVDIACLPTSSMWLLLSAMVVFRADSGTTTRLPVITGAGEAAADARIESIFLEKNWSNSSAVKLEVNTEAGSSSSCNFDHRAL